ncbi:MAG: AAA family ATPase [Myxococcota bacterium]
MYVKRAILKNVKGFAELEFDFDHGENQYEGWTVVTGDNGSGKTILLKTIAMALVGPSVTRSLQPSYEGWIKDGEKSAEISVELISHNDVDSVETGRQHKRPFWSELLITTTASGASGLEVGSERRKSKKGPTRGPWSDATSGWFAVGYGPFRRIRGASPEAQRLMSSPGRVSRFATMFKEDATLQECELWLMDLNYRKLEGREPEARLLETTIAILNDEFLQNGVRVSRVDSEGLWLEDAHGTILNLSDMSDGYRASLAMMADMIRHLASVYGQLNIKKRKNGSTYLEHTGVVLIDEADAHLHPEWQRRIGFWLKEKFPKLQFIVTTHSPHVCQAADQDGIYHLPHPSKEINPFQLSRRDYLEIIRSTADDVLLTPAFSLSHTRSPLAVRSRRDFARMKAKFRRHEPTEEEQLRFEALKKFIDPDDEDG